MGGGLNDENTGLDTFCLVFSFLNFSAARDFLSGFVLRDSGRRDKGGGKHQYSVNQ